MFTMDEKLANQFSAAIVEVKRSRNREDAVRNALIELRESLNLAEDETHDSLRGLFEASFPDLMAELSEEARQTIYYIVSGEGPLLSSYNEYVAYANLAQKIVGAPPSEFSRPGNSLASEILDSNNPIGTLYSLLRKNKRLSDNQFATLLEAAFPLATNGLDEETRDFLFQLAQERGVTAIEIANSYGELIDLVNAVRFLEDE